MINKKGSFLLSFFVGGLIGSGMTLLLAQYLARKWNTIPARVIKAGDLLDEMREQSHGEEGVYCAPEGADIHYDLEDDPYYSNKKK